MARAGRIAGVLAVALLAAATAGPAPAQQGATAGVLSRLDSLEAELRRLTAQLEQAEYDRRRLATDYEARLQDLEFRIIELEGGDPTEALRRGPSAPAPAPQPAPQAGQQATGAPPAPLGTLRATEAPPEEQAAFNAAVRDLETLGLNAGRASFDVFLQQHPGSSLGGEAWRQLGAAYAREGRWQDAARAHLRGVRDFRDAPQTPENLMGLADALTFLGQFEQACATYAEFRQRFAGAYPEMAAEAQAGAERAGCS